MQLIRCDLYHGIITAAHLTFTATSNSEPSPPIFSSALTRPLIVDQAGQVTCLSPVRSFDQAVNSAKAYVEHQHRVMPVPRSAAADLYFDACACHQGMIAAAHVQSSGLAIKAAVLHKIQLPTIRPAIFDQSGNMTLLAPVATAAIALSTAKAYIEHRNRLYVGRLLNQNLPTAVAIDRFLAWGIPFELLPDSITGRTCL